MRIAICSDVYLPQLSGAADSVALLYAGLRERGHEVRIYAPSQRGQDPDEHVKRLWALELPGSGGAAYIVTSFGMTGDLKRFKPDVIHTHFFGTIGFGAVYASWRLGVPIAGTNHTMIGDYLHYVKLDYAPFRKLAWKFLAWYYNRCVRVSAPSQDTINEMRTYGFKRPAEVIPNPILTEFFRPLPNREELKVKLGISGPAVLSFGRVAWEKNLDAALDAFLEAQKRMSDATFVVVGDGPYRQEFEKRAKEKAGERVKFLGTLRGTPLIEAMNACDVCLITSMSETQSMTTLQAMACELPMVGINAGGVPEYINEGETGYKAEPGDTALLGRRLAELLADPELARRFGAAGRQSALRFAPEKQIERFEAFYKQAIEEASRLKR